VRTAWGYWLERLVVFPMSEHWLEVWVGRCSYLLLMSMCILPCSLLSVLCLSGGLMNHCFCCLSGRWLSYGGFWGIVRWCCEFCLFPC
jgi:hypothetical protein